MRMYGANATPPSERAPPPGGATAAIPTVTSNAVKPMSRVGPLVEVARATWTALVGSVVAEANDETLASAATKQHRT